ncbi:hypothetical protein FACS1894126_5270 [Alphaproteobacteria bacterium]|nr:hypothetical protein FACS1894126_5270 [Alphaproteobacteria bacterium]
MDKIIKTLVFSVAVSVGCADIYVFAKDDSESTKQSKQPITEAEKLVRSMLDDVRNIGASITPKKSNGVVTEEATKVAKEEFKAKLKPIILKTFATTSIARRMLGITYVKQLSEEELNAFVDACMNRMISLYSSQLYEYRKAVFDVVSVKKRGSEHYFVRTKIFKNAEKSEKDSIEIDWSILVIKGEHLVSDVIVVDTKNNSEISMNQIQQGVISDKIKKEKGIKKFLKDYVEENKSSTKK